MPTSALSCASHSRTQEPATSCALKLFHRALTPDEAAALWALLHPTAMFQEGGELQVTIRLGASSTTDGWMVYARRPTREQQAVVIHTLRAEMRWGVETES
jgi:hypothetical protein